jgi:phage terminase large subunit
LKKRIRAIQGGTSASKTVSILQDLIDLAQRDKTPKLTSIVSESLPHLKKGAMLDFLSIMKDQDYFKDSRWNKSDFVYTLETGSKIEFFGVDDARKVRGPRRDRGFINEANNVSLETFEQFEIRTRDLIYLDWNPVSEFWFYTDVQGKRDDIDHLILTYKDNEALGQSIIESIERRKGRKGWWQVYGEGLLGEVEGKIYRDWAIIDEIPHEAKLERYGLDYGYSNDPTAIVAIYRYNGGYILDEIGYQKGLSNKQIADILLNNDRALVIPDSAEPKSNDELRGYGITLTPAKKGPDSVNHGIQAVQDQRISITKRSINIIKEYRNYLWMTDRDGRILNEPEHQFSHSMDAIRYGIASLFTEPERRETYIEEESEPIYSDIGI